MKVGKTLIAFFLQFLIILAILAAFLQDDHLFAILYMFSGIYIFGRLWSSKSLKSVIFKRNFSSGVFMGDVVPVELIVENSGILPLIWMRIQESIPVELITKSNLQQVISLGPKGKYSLHYYLRARKRGYYQIGPLFASTGDLFGLSGIQRRLHDPDHITVFPKIVSLTHLSLPTFSPHGTLPQKKPIFEDPSRIFGKRGYISGDSLRKIDWKSTAATGQLQVKLFEPSIALEIMIFLNLFKDDYDQRRRADLIELAIVVAASIAFWGILRKQPIGLATNGIDPFNDGQQFMSLPSRKGRGHLMRILELMARIEATSQSTLVQLLQRERVRLSWGSTIIVITGESEPDFFDELFQIQRAGMNIALIILGEVTNWSDVKSIADYFSYPIYHIKNEFDLDMWRK